MACPITGIVDDECLQSRDYTFMCDGSLVVDGENLILDSTGLQSTDLIPTDGELRRCRHIGRFYFAGADCLRFRTISEVPTRLINVSFRLDSEYKPRHVYKMTSPHYVKIGSSPHKFALFAETVGSIMFTHLGFGYINQEQCFAFDYDETTNVLTISAFTWNAMHFLMENLVCVARRNVISYNKFTAQINEYNKSVRNS